PPLYGQSRAGLDGRHFKIRKFRTMIRNAEALKAQLLALNEAPFPAFKIRNDPRITRLGRFLRKASLDELPQLWNVLVGDMSLVGPRPLPVAEAALVSGPGRARLRARPGITCIWQISNRHTANETFDDWVAKDLDYIEHWSLWLDLVLLVKTARAVVRMTGS
ncbi:MAG: sugar transferase, partial [Chloroflexota bacterium]|nr:sugar transferase [Chloroflexota bacterium]